MLFEDYQFKTNKMVHICFYLLLCCNVSIFICFLGIIISLGFVEENMPWKFILIMAVIAFGILCIGILGMLAMRFKRLQIDEEKIIRTNIFNQKSVYPYQKEQLRIVVCPTFALNRGIKLSFYLNGELLFHYDLVESVATVQTIDNRRKAWGEGLASIGSAIEDDRHCLFW